ncbi:uncharacterized protein LOC110458074 isoform X2 [Mizuhopecten yessoensis]|uniref:uncharacterized protein LOC110458074 isoform X2 n=1 Tax=Mizuhopecten yessoensis TaxID=6573 RepID=UPI000B45F3DD|nr:uncharacterized protein LOC110458074 isoform X2 [Mizuhopecten yessoensis]
MSNHVQVQVCDSSGVNTDTCRAEVEQLRAAKKTLEGKIQGYNFLGNRLREKDEECRQLKQKLAEVAQNNLSKTDGRSVSPENDYVLTSNKTIQTSLHLLNDYHTTTTTGLHANHLPQTTLNQASTRTTDLFGSAPKQANNNPMADDCLFLQVEKDKPTNYVNVSSNHTTVDTNRLFPSGTKPLVYGPPGEGVTYPPNFGRQQRESFQNHEVSRPINLPPTDVLTNSFDQTDGPTKGGGSPRTHSTTELTGYDVPNKASLNLMNFEDKILYPPTSDKTDDQAVDKLISMQVRADLVTDGPPQNVVKYFENHLLPMLQKQEQENKSKEEQWNNEKSKLLQKIQQLEMHKGRNVTQGQSLSENQVPGWDVVHRTEAMNQSEVKMLEDHNKQLVEANRSWQAFHEKSQAEQQKTADYYKEKFEGMTKEILRMKTQDEQKKADFQKILFEAKQKQIDEEALKEELQHYKVKAESFEKQLEQVRPGILQNNMNALHIAGTSGPPAFNVTNHKTLNDLQVENDTLRCQLTVFQEDFDRERSDRAQAQATKETFKEELETVKQELHYTKNQLKQKERQARHAETNCQQAHLEKDKLQQQIAELKNTLRREKEANAMQYQRPFQPQFQPVPQHPGYVNHPVAMMNGAPHIEQSRVAAQPQTDPFAQPIPPYMVNTHQRSSGSCSPQPPPDFKFQRTVPSQNHKGEWQCGRCTVNNHPSRTVCEVCGYTQPFIQQRQGGIPAQLYRQGYNGDQVEPCESGDLSTDTGDLAQS